MAKKMPQDICKDYAQEPENIRHLIYIENIESFARYDEKRGFFKILSKDNFHRDVYLYMVKEYAQPITTNLTKDIVNQLHWYIQNKIEDVILSEYIALEDKLLNLKTGGFEPFSAQKPTFYNIDCKSTDLDIKNCPRWLQFLDEVLINSRGEPDQELKNLVQEMFGYSLMNTLEGHASFFLVGDGNNGKSVMLSVLRRLVGEDYAHSATIESLTTNQFAPVGLIGKKINVSVEEESSFVKSDKFKALVSGDNPITVEYKFGNSFEWTPTVKFFFATNELPTFTGFNEGLLRRLNIIPFNKRIGEKERDTKLTEKLYSELGGIVAWALLGMKRLQANKFHFTKAEQAIKKLEEFSGNLSSGILFWRENYEKNENAMTFLDEFYENYKIWADKRGKKKQSYYSVKADLKKIGLGEEAGGWVVEPCGRREWRKMAPIVIKAGGQEEIVW